MILVEETVLSRTHGGEKAKEFRWIVEGRAVVIKNEEGRVHRFEISEISQVLGHLHRDFGRGWFPLANSVSKMPAGTEKAGLGSFIYRMSGDVTHAQGASYLGVVLEEAGILEWNQKSTGIEWRIRVPHVGEHEVAQMLVGSLSGTPASRPLREERHDPVGLSETPEGLRVEQSGRFYVARNWVFSDRLLRLMSVAFECGLTCLIRNGHPKPDKTDAEHVGFSRAKNAHWVFVVDQFSCRDGERRDDIRQITVHKRFEEALDKAGVRWRWESPGGEDKKNIFVDYDHAEAAIRVCCAAKPG
jgi:hypothetical protein